MVVGSNAVKGVEVKQPFLIKKETRSSLTSSTTFRSCCFAMFAPRTRDWIYL